MSLLFKSNPAFPDLGTFSFCMMSSKLLIPQLKTHQYSQKISQFNTGLAFFLPVSRVLLPGLQELCTGFSRVIGVTVRVTGVTDMVTLITLACFRQ